MERDSGDDEAAQAEFTGSSAINSTNVAPAGTDALTAHHLRAQTRLKGVIQEVTYTDTKDGTGHGIVRCIELDRAIPFSCRNISLEKGQLRIASVMDPCTLKLSCRGTELRATSIRIKARKSSGAIGPSPNSPTGESHPSTSAGSSHATSSHVSSPLPVGRSWTEPQSIPRSLNGDSAHHGEVRGEPSSSGLPGRSGATAQAPMFPAVVMNPASLFDGNSPLNAFEYAGAATTGLSASGSSLGYSPQFFGAIAGHSAQQ
jgi:hypothetical protein